MRIPRVAKPRRSSTCPKSNFLPWKNGGRKRRIACLPFTGRSVIGPAQVQRDFLFAHDCRLEETLQVAYEELLESVPINDPDLPHLAREKLEKAHQAWLAFRKEPCGYRGFLEGGVPGSKTVYEDEGLIAATQSRLDELKSIRKSYQ